MTAIVVTVTAALRFLVASPTIRLCARLCKGDLSSLHGLIPQVPQYLASELPKRKFIVNDEDPWALHGLSSGLTHAPNGDQPAWSLPTALVPSLNALLKASNSSTVERLSMVGLTVSVIRDDS